MEKALLKRVAESISHYDMFARGHPVGVAVSGGADSTALLHVMAELAPQWSWRLVVLHANHGLRGNESEEDARFVERMAESMGLAWRSIHLPVSAAGGNLEDAARRARYGFFREMAAVEGLARVAVGHTRSDQAETVLFRLLRGSATTGLAGIWPVTDEGIVRPLIDVSREEVRAFLRARGIAWREDSSNGDPRFARNRIRHQLLPTLRREWNPELDAALAHLAELCQDEERYWRREGPRLLSEAAQSRDGALVIEVDRLRDLPVAALRRSLREAVARVRRDGRPVDYRHVEELVELVRKPEGTGRAATPGIDACRSFGWLRLAPAGLQAQPYRVELPVPGEVRLPGGGRLGLELERRQPDNRYNTSGAALDWERTPGKLELRSWKPGVTFWPAGQPHAIKLKVLLQQARVPSWERLRWPMIHYGETAIWVRGFGVAEGFQATESTRTALVVREFQEQDGF